MYTSGLQHLFIPFNSSLSFFWWIMKQKITCTLYSINDFTNGVKIMSRKQWGDKNSDKNDESISFFDTTLLEC